jgi:hypothetical protein
MQSDDLTQTMIDNVLRAAKAADLLQFEVLLLSLKGYCEPCRESCNDPHIMARRCRECGH